MKEFIGYFIGLLILVGLFVFADSFRSNSSPTNYDCIDNGRGGWYC